MKQVTLGPSTPTAHIAVNKSRLKAYYNAGSLPTYYLKKGQEFSIELYNPTQEVILAKIELNSKSISQGGIVLNPGQRVFLERYLDVDRKFLFDTYEVDGSAETQHAIAKNGDLTVKFYKERQQVRNYYPTQFIDYGYYNQFYNSGTGTVNLTNVSSTPINNTFYNTTSLGSTLASHNSATNDAFLSFDGNLEMNMTKSSNSPLRRGFVKKSKSVETGRVEQGSKSDQKFESVDKTFEFTSFASSSYKLLPISQKINTTVSFKKYCTNCGAKLGKTDKFCSSCGTKA